MSSDIRIKNIINSSLFLSGFLDKSYLFDEIKEIEKKDNCYKKPIYESNEPLVGLNGYDIKTGSFLQHYNRIFVSPAYFKKNINGALPIISAREGVLNSLLKLLELLPKQYGIIVYDGYRPISVQQALYDDFYEKVKNKIENKAKTQEELEKITKMFVSIPSRDSKKPSTHNTGGAIDFAICDSNGIQLNFGCDFDDFRLIANTMYFEDKLKNNEELSNLELEAMLNRRVLFNLAINSGVGLQPYDGEWWHFDKNNQWDLKLDKVLYGSCEFVKIKSN